MSSIKKPVGLIVMVGVLGWGAAGHAQPSIPKDRIPSSIPAEVRQRIERLYSSDPQERAHAAGRLVNNSEQAAPAIPFLIAMFHDDTVLYDEAKLASRSSISSYLSPFPFPNSPGEVAARALGRIASRTRKPPIDALLVAMKDKDRHVRANAIMALGETSQLEDLRVLEPLVVLLEDKCPTVRANAVRTLRGMELKEVWANESLMEGLVARIEDIDKTVRVEAVRALGSAKDSRAVRPLIVVLENLSESPEVRENAAQALGQIGDPAAVPHLVVALKDEDWRIRFGSLAVVDLIKEYRVLRPIVIGALQDKEWRVRARAASAAAVLSKLKDPGSLEVLIAALGDRHPNVRAGATEACGESKDPRTIIRLTAILEEDPNSYVRWHAANALGELGDPGAIDPLTAALKDQNETVRTSARRALERIQKAIRLRRI